MNAKQLADLAVAALEDIKGREIEVIDTSRLTPLFEYIVVASGDSNRQVRSLARNVHDKLREAGQEVLSVEGEDAGDGDRVQGHDALGEEHEEKDNRYKQEDCNNKKQSNHRFPFSEALGGADQ